MVSFICILTQCNIIIRFELSSLGVELRSFSELLIIESHL